MLGVLPLEGDRGRLARAAAVATDGWDGTFSELVAPSTARAMSTPPSTAPGINCLDTPDPPRTQRYCLHFAVSRRRGLIRTLFYRLPCKYADRLKHSTQLMQPYAA